MNIYFDAIQILKALFVSKWTCLQNVRWRLILMITRPLLLSGLDIVLQLITSFSWHIENIFPFLLELTFIMYHQIIFDHKSISRFFNPCSSVGTASISNLLLTDWLGIFPPEKNVCGMSQPKVTYSKLTIEPLEQDVKYVWC